MKLKEMVSNPASAVRPRQTNKNIFATIIMQLHVSLPLIVISSDTDTTEAVDTDTTEALDEPEVESCECQACSDPSTPHQPLNVSEPKTAHSSESKERREGTKTYSRKIQQS